MYKIGDHIVYGGNGVCEVTDIGVSKIGVDDRKYYTLNPVYSSEKILIPVDNDKIVMRDIISKDSAEELIKSIPTLSVEWNDNNRVREQQYKDTIKKFDCEGFLEIIETIKNQKKKCDENGKKMSVMDDRYYKIASNFFDGELAFALNISKEEVENYIRNALDKM